MPFTVSLNLFAITDKSQQLRLDENQTSVSSNNLKEFI